MKDMIPKGTGNSRKLKSSLSTGTTWEQALEMLRAGTFPIDLNGLNADGIQQEGTALNKANLLSDDTASALGLSGDPTVDDALEKLQTNITTTESKIELLKPEMIYEAAVNSSQSTTSSSNSYITLLSFPLDEGLIPAITSGEYDTLYFQLVGTATLTRKNSTYLPSFNILVTTNTMDSTNGIRLLNIGQENVTYNTPYSISINSVIPIPLVQYIKLPSSTREHIYGLSAESSDRWNFQTATSHYLRTAYSSVEFSLESTFRVWGAHSV